MLEHPREVILALTLLLASISAALLYIALFTRRRPTTACRACHYDLSSHAPPRCPECGRDPRLSTPARRRTRWRPLVAAVVLAMLVTGLFLARTPIQNAWWNSLPAWIPAHARVYRGIEYRILTPRGPIDRPRESWMSAEQRLECRTAATAWTVIIPSDFSIDLDAIQAADVTSDGIPEHLLESYSGGAHCCHTLYVLDPTREGLLLGVIEGTHSSFEVRDLDQDGVAEISLLDWTFAYWNTSFFGSPAPTVILAFDGAGLSPAVHLMRSPPPTDEDLEQEAAAARAAVLSINDDPVPILHPFWGRALDLLYSGNPDHAWRFLDLAWPGDGAWQLIPTKAAFRAEFEAQLLRSPWWPRIASGYAALTDNPAASDE